MRVWLKRLRTQRKLTQKETAALLGITQTAYSKIENAERREELPLRLAVKITEIFDVGLNDIAQYENARVSA